MVMSLEQLEAEVKQLKTQVAEGAYAKNYLEIWKLTSLYSHMYYIGRNAEVPNLFAQNTPDVSLEIEDSGVYVGIDSIRRFWTEVFDANRMQRSPGWLAVHMTVNPVSGDPQKRHHGQRDLALPRICLHDPRRNLHQNACMGKYIFDYVKENGQWKFSPF